jgi:hypothetical protein
VLFANDVHAQFNAFITDEYGRTCNQFADLMLAFAAKGAIEGVLGITVTGLAHILFVPCWGVTSDNCPDRGESLTDTIEQ